VNGDALVEGLGDGKLGGSIHGDYYLLGPYDVGNELSPHAIIQCDGKD